MAEFATATSDGLILDDGSTVGSSSGFEGAEDFFDAPGADEEDETTTIGARSGFEGLEDLRLDDGQHDPDQEAVVTEEADDVGESLGFFETERGLVFGSRDGGAGRSSLLWIGLVLIALVGLSSRGG